ncbi:MAG: sulfurtransferase TusA family protein [Proteobacteria bacterium]|nr:sulfurtransferase TusA family protein [Pseudomonadota bacterium]
MKDRRLDARGLICPLPVLKARKVLLQMNSGDTLHVLITDKAAPQDFQLFCNESGHLLKSVQNGDEEIEVVIECRKTNN